MSKITEYQLNGIVMNISSNIEAETEITISSNDLYVLNDTLSAYLRNQCGVEIVKEPEEFEPTKHLLLTTGCHHGVVAFPKDESFAKELHGPFLTETEARHYIHKMKREYEDYQRFAVCKIELPVTSPDVIA